ncbi:MAG: cupin domain-containing protein [Robiginitalea sp.]|jgi:quercetin dioxygenase-like cupin family protein
MNNLNPTRVIPSLTLALCTLFCASISAQEMSLAHSIDDPNLVWSPAPDFFPGCTFTVLHGDLESPNLDFLFRVEPNTEVVEHTHTSPERMILVAGKMEVTYEGEPTRVLNKGDYAYGPAGKPHRAKCLGEGPCVLYVGMVDPFDAMPVEE